MKAAQSADRTLAQACSVLLNILCESDKRCRFHLGHAHRVVHVFTNPVERLDQQQPRPTDDDRRQMRRVKPVAPPSRGAHAHCRVDGRYYASFIDLESGIVAIQLWRRLSPLLRGRTVELYTGPPGGSYARRYPIPREVKS